MNPVRAGNFHHADRRRDLLRVADPGVGFPLVAAVLGAVLYFFAALPRGMVQNWEPILFVVGLLLIAVEIFVLPGFGIAGIAGIVAVVTGLAFAAIDNDVLRHVFPENCPPGGSSGRFWSLSSVPSRHSSPRFYFGRRFLTGDSRLRSWIVLTTDLTPEQGLCRPPVAAGRPGRPHRDGHRRSASVRKDRARRDLLRCGRRKRTFIGRGEKVRVVRVGNGQLYCKQDFSDPSES